jgi:hypothetical protein
MHALSMIISPAMRYRLAALAYLYSRACVCGHARSLQQADSQCWTPLGLGECATIGCVHSVPLGLPECPLSPEMLARSIPYSIHDQRLHAALDRARSGQPLDIVVIGGSVTLGHGCKL